VGKSSHQFRDITRESKFTIKRTHNNFNYELIREAVILYFLRYHNESQNEILEFSNTGTSFVRCPVIGLDAYKSCIVIGSDEPFAAPLRNDENDWHALVQVINYKFL
jgi:hypothetical protein